MKIRNAIIRYTAVPFGLALAGTAAAETPTIDVTAATGMLSGDATDAIVAVGGALLVLAAVAVGFKWAKGAIFG